MADRCGGGGSQSVSLLTDAPPSKLRGNDRLVENPAALSLESNDLAESDRELLQYAIKLTRDTSGVSAVDIESLWRVGFDDRAIHDDCQTVAYFASVNRIGDGLGVELEQ